MNKKIFLLFFFILLAWSAIYSQQTNPVRIPIPQIDINVNEAKTPQQIALSLQILFLLSILTLAPSIIVLMTAFLRIAIVFDFLKKALSLQQMPPNQVIFGLSLFLTFFIMFPTFERIYNEALLPFFNPDVVPKEKRLTTIDQFYEKSINPLRDFMF